MPVPVDERLHDFGGQALARVLSVDGVAEAAPCVIANEACTADEFPVVLREPPLGPASLAVFCHVLLDKLDGLSARLRAPEAHVPHGLGIRVHLKQGCHVAGKPGCQDQALRTKHDVVRLTSWRVGALHDRNLAAVLRRCATRTPDRKPTSSGTCYSWAGRLSARRRSGLRRLLTRPVWG